MTPQGAIEIIKIAIAEVEWNYPMEYAEAFENAISTKSNLCKYALDLINRLQAENKRLSTLAELGNKRADDYRVMRDRALKAEKEVERLQDILLAFMQALGKVRNVDDIESILQIPIMWELNKQFRAEIKAEAYKEFAERLKEDLKNSTLWGLVSFDRIDNLLKELVGDSNG